MSWFGDNFFPGSFDTTAGGLQHYANDPYTGSLLGNEFDQQQQGQQQQQQQAAQQMTPTQSTQQSPLLANFDPLTGVPSRTCSRDSATSVTHPSHSLARRPLNNSSNNNNSNSLPRPKTSSSSSMSRTNLPCKASTTRHNNNSPLPNSPSPPPSSVAQTSARLTRPRPLALHSRMSMSKTDLSPE
ncbi:hypothetical protein V1509DRAFT_134667 [Lipomyces kononenkoae]